MEVLMRNAPIYQTITLLLDFAIIGSVILLIGFCLAFLYRHSAPALRHIVWSSTLIALIIAPVVGWIVPDIQVPFFTSPFENMTEGEALAPAAEIQTASEGTSLATGEAEQIESKSVIQMDLSSRLDLDHTGKTQGKSQNPLLPVLEAVRDIQWTLWVWMIWIAGVCMVILWYLAGIAGVWWIGFTAIRPGGEAWEMYLEEFCDRLMIRRPVRLLFTTRLISPLTWGIFRPIIILPVEAEDWDEGRKRHVLIHELAHIKRLDCLTQFVTQFGCALHWFNPLAWSVFRRMRIDQEKASDDLVLAQGMKASDYAGHLVEIAKTLRSNMALPLQAVAMARRTHLEGRVIDILDPMRSTRRFKLANGIITACIAFLLMLPLGALKPWQAHDGVITELKALNRTMDTFPEPAQAPADPVETSRSTIYDTASAVTSSNVPVPVEAPLPVTEDAARGTSRSSLSSLTNVEREFLAKVEPEPTHPPNPEGSSLNKAPQAIGLSWDTEYEMEADADTTEKEKARQRAILALRSTLDDSDPEIRVQAIQTLAMMDDVDSAEMIARMASSDPDRNVRRHALMALEEFETDDFLTFLKVETLQRASRDADADLRKHAVMLMSRYRNNPRIEEILLYMLRDKDPDVRRQAVMGLADQGSDKGLLAISDMINDVDENVRRYVVMSISTHGGEKAVPILRSALRDKDPEVRQMAIMGLARHLEADVLPLLEPLSNDKSPEVRRQIVLVYGKYGTREHIPLLIQLLLNDSEVDIRSVAAMSLGGIGHIDAVDPLTKALQDPSTVVRKHAAVALSQIDY